MNDIKILSVVVPCYNVAGYLSRCLSSLVHQDIDGSAYEVIAVDDGSTDSTGEICDRYAKDYPQVKVMHQANRGVGAARNAGLDLAQGKYLLFVDADDFMVENCFKELLDTAEANLLDVLAYHSVDVMQGPVWWLVTKREIIEKERLRFPEGHMLEDSPFTPEVILSAQRMANIGKVCYYYVQRPSSIMHSRDREHLLTLLDDYIFAYKSVDEVIAKHRHKMDESAYTRLASRRDSFLYFGIFRALKSGVAKEFYQHLKNDGLLPLRQLDKREFASKKWNILRLLFNCPALTCGIGKIYGFIR